MQDSDESQLAESANSPAPQGPGAEEHQPGKSAPRPTGQAERAAMQPHWHDMEWDYYHGAWSG